MPKALVHMKEGRCISGDIHSPAASPVQQAPSDLYNTMDVAFGGCRYLAAVSGDG